MTISSPPSPEPSKPMRWSGYVLTTLPVLGLLFSASMKLAQPPGLEEGIAHLGLPMSQITGIGFLELACTVVYLIPRTSVLGAVLLTGYLGGATAIHVRVGDPFYATVFMGVLVWGGLFLRDARIRALIPLRR